MKRMQVAQTLAHRSRRLCWRSRRSPSPRAPSTAAAQTLVKLKAGMVTGIDQVGLPIALERGFFEKHGLDVTVARPYATGVDALNALQAGESEIVQVGVPMIGAVLRGMDLVALGNYSGNATKLGSDATVALVAREGRASTRTTSRR